MSKGVTLIELLVGITCFSIVVSLVIGIFVTSLKAKNRIKELSLLRDEARYIMDYISREIRTAEIKTGGGEHSTLNIKNSQNEHITYKFLGNKIKRQNQDLNIIDVTGTFVVDKDASPAKVMITMTLTKNNKSITVSTTISSRVY